MRILILNWRDPHHPKSGGAETFTHEVAKRLVTRGDKVEWFAASFPGAAVAEELDGVRIVRGGRQWSVHWQAWRRYRKRIRLDFDVVIDEVNTMPFFTPLWGGIPVYMLIFQLAREVWWYESRFPLSALGFTVEPLYLKIYRRTPVFTISASTERDLRRLGYRAAITVIPIGIERIVKPDTPKSEVPTFVYVGRLAPSKRIEDLIEAVAEFRRGTGAGRLWLVGDGAPAYAGRLRALAARLGVAEAVEFHGRVTAPTKHRLMAEAHALLMASVREGWGLVVTEAAACGTPAIVYDVGGLRDSVRNQETGLVVAGTPQALAEGMRRLWCDPDLYRRLAAEAERWSRTFTFERAAETVMERIS